jgi:hypothetical protein
MLIAAAFCPHPPLLVPEVTGVPGPDHAELARLRAACLAAVAALAASQPDLIVVVGSAPGTAEYRPDALASLAQFGVPAPEPADVPVLPLSLAVASWLLANARPHSIQARVTWQGIAADAPPAQCLALGEKIAALAPRVAVLAMGDGPGCRARGVPGAVDPAADRYDGQVAAALAGPDPGVLASLDPRMSDDLFASGRTAWQVAAGAVGHDDFAATLGYAAVPFEVSYFVANWRRISRPPRAH